MCGIIGYTGKGNAFSLVSSGLKNLEYRGYDSSGIAFPLNGSLKLFKGTGCIGKIIKGKRVFSPSAIGHTRWATHGKVSRKNAHPHFSCGKEIAVVHNGIIENFPSLKKRLRGHKFSSETDSEIIAHLIEEKLNPRKGLLKAVQETAGFLKGSFAFLVLSSLEPEKIVAVKKDSPLLLGFSKKGVFASSDQTPLLKHTDRFLFLDDFEIALLSGKNAKVFDFNLKAVNKKIHKIDAAYSTSRKLRYSHFMLKEILEQDSTFLQALEQDFSQIKRIAKKLSRRNVFFVSNGTSFNASLVGADLFQRFSSKTSAVLNASEFPYKAGHLPKNSLVVAISQSGETADVLHAVKLCKKKKIPVIALVNVFGSSLARAANETIYLKCGSEIGVASTKAFTSQLAVLYLLSFALQGKTEKGAEELKKLAPKLTKTIKLSREKAKRLAQAIKKKNDVYFIGRGANYPLAQEGALKLKEISYLHAEAFPAGELKHGPLALVGRQTPVLCVAPSDETFSDTLNNVSEAKSRGAFIIGISDKNRGEFDFRFPVPKVKQEFFPLLLAIPMQFLALYTSLALKRNPDRPRNLAKSVTVR